MRHLRKFNESKAIMEDVMWCLVDIFDKFNMIQKESINTKWNYNQAYNYDELFPGEYNVWRYNNDNEIVIVCPLEHDNYKTWHSIISYLKESERLIKETLNIDIVVEYSVYRIGLIRISV